MILRSLVAAWMALTGASVSATESGSREAWALNEAETAVRGFRERSFLPTPCERAFRDFWTAYVAPGDEGLLAEPYIFSPRDHFGWGNLAAAPLLEAAQTVCAEQTGARGDLVVRVLTDREKAKAERKARIRKAHSLIKGY
jgi:hypothetical protein